MPGNQQPCIPKPMYYQQNKPACIRGKPEGPLAEWPHHLILYLFGILPGCSPIEISCWQQTPEEQRSDLRATLFASGPDVDPGNVPWGSGHFLAGFVVCILLVLSEFLQQRCFLVSGLLSSSLPLLFLCHKPCESILGVGGCGQKCLACCMVRITRQFGLPISVQRYGPGNRARLLLVPQRTHCN